MPSPDMVRCPLGREERLPLVENPALGKGDMLPQGAMLGLEESAAWTPSVYCRDVCFARPWPGGAIYLSS